MIKELICVACPLGCPLSVEMNEKGEILSWAESSAVVYANSVLGARCNRNSGIVDLMGSVVGFVPYFGLLTDEGRKASWVVRIETTKKPEAQLLGFEEKCHYCERFARLKELSLKARDNDTDAIKEITDIIDEI